MGKQKIELLCLQGHRLFHELALYDANEGKGRVIDKKIAFLPFFYEPTGTIYGINAEDIFRDGRKDKVFIDVNRRVSINVPKLLAGVIDGALLLKLETISEKNMYEGVSAIKSLQLRWFIALLLAGVGLYAIVKLLLSSAGYYIP